MKKTIIQLIKFGIVGIICFAIDYGLMIILTEYAKLPYLLSCGISFSISVVVNYLLSMRYVFVSRHDLNKEEEFTLFVFLSIMGLFITEVEMYLLTSGLKIHYTIAKIVVTGIVMMFNFIARKLLLDESRSG